MVVGDIDVHLQLTEPEELDESLAEARQRSQTDTKAVFWTATLSEAVDRETVELYRSRELLSRKERGAQTKDETALVAEEKRRQKRHEDELKRLLKQALLSGSAFFRGNDRSPDESATEVGLATAQIVSVALPEVFDRFAEAAAHVKKADLEALMKNENLLGLTPVFAQLQLLRDESASQSSTSRKHRCPRCWQRSKIVRVWRDTNREIPRRRIRKGAVWLGL